MKNSKKMLAIVLFSAIAAEATSTPIKALNKQNQMELRELILSLDATNGAASIKEIDDKKESVAKTRQALINLASSLLPEDQAFETAGGKALAEKAAKAPKVDFTGYTEADLAGFAANVGHECTFKPSSRYENVEANADGTVNGVIKSYKIESRSGRCFYEIKVEGLAKSAWTRDTNSTLVIGKLAPVVAKEPTKAELAAKAKEEKAAAKVEADAKKAEVAKK